MQQVKTYTSGMFKGEARDPFAKDVKKKAILLSFSTYLLTALE